ncbi:MULTISPECIES: hypothetical protein [unclassified Thioalkalivibrio]|uniref:hypothetical protein n=1 Tax=unclassified Thioalkalivibrio TaxID=2621013 RepID=UPI00037E4C03|nr:MULTISPECIES: hypothetical protein [unclassified Thioalkalivibrio]
MQKDRFKSSAIRAALGFGAAGLAMPFGSAAVAAPVGNLAASPDNRFSVDIGLEHSRRDMHQRGTANYWTFTSGDETLTEGFRGLDAREDQTDLYAQINFSVTPRIELYGRAGATRTRLTDFGSFNYELTEEGAFTEGPGNGGRMSLETGPFDADVGGFSSGSTSTGWLAALGAKFDLHEWEDHGAGLTLDVMYQIRDAGGGWDLMTPVFAGGGDPIQARGDDRVHVDGYKSSEWHAALILERRVGSFRPYGGIKYSRIKSDYDLERSSEFEAFDGQTGTLRMRNDREVGFLGGMEYLMTSNMSLTGEIRAGDETALNLGLRYRFE